MSGCLAHVSGRHFFFTNDITEPIGVVTRGGPGWPLVGLQSGEIIPG